MKKTRIELISPTGRRNDALSDVHGTVVEELGSFIQERGEEARAVPDASIIWDKAKIDLLTQLYLQSPISENTRDVSRRIAGTFGLPAEKVEKKIHALHLPRTKQYQLVAHQRALKAREEKPENALLLGPYLWSVTIDTDDKQASWLLHYRYGEFPYQLRDKEIAYSGIRYRITRIYTQVLLVSRISSSNVEANENTSRRKEI